VSDAIIDTDRIFHLALPEDWAAAFTSGEYTMSTRGRTLAEEGFIHASTHEQLEATANRFYGDVDQLVLLSINVEKIPHDIRWEPPAPGIHELFPHIYGPLPVAAVVRTDFWLRTVDESDMGWTLANL
jgi:glutathione S-transferase